MNPTDTEATLALRWALEHATVSDLVGSEELIQSFYRFLATGTVLQQRKLCPRKAASWMSQATETDDDNNSTEIRRETIPQAIQCSSSAPSRRKACQLRQPSVQERCSTAHICPRTHQSRELSIDLAPRLMSQNSTSTLAVSAINSSFRSVQTSTSPATTSVPTLSVVSPTAPETSENTLSPDSPASIAQESLSHTSASDTTSASLNLLPSYSPDALSLPTPSVVAPGSPGSSEEFQTTVLSKARVFFENRLGSRICRARYLVRATQSFMEVPDLTPDFFQDMWGLRSDIFRGVEETGSVARFRRLCEGHRKIKQGCEEYACADRFCYIFLVHDLEQLQKSGDLAVSQGRGRKTAAFYKQAEGIFSTVDAVRANRSAARGYLHLLMEGGPGFLLCLGRQVSTIWERKLSKADICLILEFLERQLPEVHAKIRALDLVAAQALLDGFIAYGWTRAELAATQGDVVDRLKHYINMEDIKHDRENRGLLDDCESQDTISVFTEDTQLDPTVNQNTMGNFDSTAALDADLTTNSPFSLVTDLNDLAGTPFASTSPIHTPRESKRRRINCVDFSPSWNTWNEIWGETDIEIIQQLDEATDNDQPYLFCRAPYFSSEACGTS